MTPPPPGLDTAGAKAWPRLFGPPIAHRGLWSRDPAEGRPENSLAAFRAAAEGGYGVELDVRLSADGAPMVFHDDELGRMTGEDGRFDAHDAASLGRLRLAGTDEAIPTLAAALEAVGEALVLVELKVEAADDDRLPVAAAPLILAHPGPLAVIGFGRGWHRRFGARHPQVLRGLNFTRESMASALAGEPEGHFDLPHLDLLPDLADRRAAGRVQVSWTARSPEAFAQAMHAGENTIFEGFTP